MFAVLATGLGLVLALLFSETVLRIYVASRGWTANCYVTGLVFFVPHATAGYTLRPNLRLKSSTYDIRTNAFGLRGPELAASRSHEGSTRIMVLGGSSVFGYLVAEGQDSCVLLQDALAGLGNLPPVEVLNAGVPGYNLRQCRLRYQADLATLKPDYVLIYAGWNDSKNVIADEPEQLDLTPPAPSVLERGLSRSTTYGLLRYRLFPPAAPKFSIPASESVRVTQAGSQQFQEELQALIDAIRASGAVPILSTQLMAAASQCQGLEAFLGNTQAQIAVNQAVGQWISQAVRDAANQNALTLIDVQDEVDCDVEQLGDAIHLTAQGHASVAQAWAEGIAAILLESQPARQRTAASELSE